MPSAATKNLAFLVSGGGSNLKFVHHCIQNGLLPGLRLSMVIADRACSALEFARTSLIPCTQITYSQASPQQLQSTLAQANADLIVTNIYKILDKQTVAEFGSRMINLHYSLLPLYAAMIGEEPVKAAIADGCQILGTTVHRVTEQVDAGPILGQSAINIVPGEAYSALMQRIFESGCLNLWNVICEQLALPVSHLKMGTRFPNTLLGNNSIPQELLNPEFWTFCSA